MLLLRALPVIFAAVCILTGLFLPRLTRRRIRRPVYTKAEVVSCVTQQVYKKRTPVTLQAPVLRFGTSRGEVTAPSADFLPEWQYRYTKGQTVTICYEEARPAHFVICAQPGGDVRRILLLTAGVGTLLAYAVLWLQYEI